MTIVSEIKTKKYDYIELSCKQRQLQLAPKIKYRWRKKNITDTNMYLLSLIQKARPNFYYKCNLILVHCMLYTNYFLIICENMQTHFRYAQIIIYETIIYLLPVLSHQTITVAGRLTRISFF